ncbi:10257_t:CDS:1, partial [Gigaspora rosea]
MEKTSGLYVVKHCVGNLVEKNRQKVVKSASGKDLLDGMSFY